MCELSKEELDGYFEVKKMPSMSVIDYINWKHGGSEKKIREADEDADKKLCN